MFDIFRLNMLLPNLDHDLPTSFCILHVDIVKLDFWEFAEVLDRLLEPIED